MRLNISQQNRIDILDIIRTNGAQSRVDIAHQIGLTKPAITMITNEMLQKGILVEKGMPPTEQALSRGRRKILLDINESYKLAFGICIDKYRISIGIANLKGQSLAKISVSIEGKQYREVLETIVTEVTALYKLNYIPPAQILGVGICISDGCADFIEATDKLTRLKRDLAHAISFKIVADTTASGALYAAKLFSNEDYDSMLILRFDEVVESGAWINGDVFRSASGNPGGLNSLYPPETENGHLSFTKLVQNIRLCHAIFDTEAVILMGRYFEENFDAISQALEEGEFFPIISSVVTSETLFLSGCALAIEYFFDKTGTF